MAEVWNRVIDGTDFFEWQKFKVKGKLYTGDNWYYYIIRYPLNYGINKRRVERILENRYGRFANVMLCEDGVHRYYQTRPFQELELTDEEYGKIFGNDT